MISLFLIIGDLCDETDEMSELLVEQELPPQVREECEGFGLARVRIVRFTCGITMRYLVDMTRSAIISHRDSIAYVGSLVTFFKLSDIDRDLSFT